MRNRIPGWAVVASLLLPALTARAEGRVQVAVLDFAGPEESWIGRGLALLVERELAARDGVAVIDRIRLRAVLDEAGLAGSGLLAPEARRAFAAAALDLAVGGAWERSADGGIRVVARVLEAETGKVLAQAEDEAPPDGLAAAAARIAERLAAGLDRRAPGIAAPPSFVLPPMAVEELSALCLAGAAEEAGDYAAADGHLRRGLAGRPDSASLRLAQGKLLLRMGEPVHAALALREVVRTGGPAAAADALPLLCRTFEFDLGRLDLAAAGYRELVRRFPWVGSAERSRVREIELLDRAGRGPDAFLRTAERRDGFLARLANLDVKTRWFGAAYDRLSGEVNGIEDELAARWTALTDAERSGLPRPRSVHLVEEDGLDLVLCPTDFGYGQFAWDRTIHLVAPAGSSIVSLELAVDSAPDLGVPPPSQPADRTGIRVTSGYQELRFGSGSPPAGTEEASLVFDAPARQQSIFVDTGYRYRRLRELRARIVLGPPPPPPEPKPGHDPPGTTRIVSGVAGTVSTLSAMADGDDLVMVFSDVATTFDAQSVHYPWPNGKDADLYLARLPAGAEKAVAVRLPLSSEGEDLFPTLARDPAGTWRLLWISDRRTGFTFEPFTATSADLVHWSWPRPARLDLAARPNLTPDLRLANLGQVLPFTVPRLFCDGDGRWSLLVWSSWGPGGPGTYLLESGDGEAFGPPVRLSGNPPAAAGLAAAPGGGTLAFWVEREGDFLPGDPPVLHVLRTARVVGGRVRDERRIPLGEPVPRNPRSWIPTPWLGPDGAIYAVAFRLYRVSPEGVAVPAGDPLPAFGASVAVATPAGVHLLRTRGRFAFRRTLDGGIDDLLLDLPGRPDPAPPREAIDLPPGSAPRAGPIRVAVLPVEARGSADDSALGEAATALVLEALSGAPGVQLVERERLGAVLAEATAAERTGAEGGARIGALAGADRVFAGDVLVAGETASVTLREIDVRTTRVLFRKSWTGKRGILLPMLASVAAEMGTADRRPEAGVERREDDAEARARFVSAVSDVLAGITDRATGDLFEALRLGLSYPPTRFWLGRALEAEGDAAGAREEYVRYLDESPEGAFAAEAKTAADRLAAARPTDADWVPRVKGEAAESDLLRRIYRGRTLDDRAAALDEYVAGPGRERADALLTIFDLEADEWFRLRVIEALARVDPKLLLRAAARESRRGGGTMIELGNLLAGVVPAPWVEEVLLSCLGGEETDGTAESWAGAALLPDRIFPTGELPARLRRAVDEALASDDPARLGRALDLAGRARGGVPFQAAARIYAAGELPAGLRSRAASAMLRADFERAWAAFLPRLLAGKDVELIPKDVYWIPVPLEPGLLEELLLDPATESWHGILLETARQRMKDGLGALALRMMDAPSVEVRRRGVSLYDPKTAAAPARAALARISRSDPDPELRKTAFYRRLSSATVEEAEEILAEIAEMPDESERYAALGSLSYGLSFRPPPLPDEGPEGWARWLAFFRAERERTGPLLAELRAEKEPAPERAMEIVAALARSRDPEAATALAAWIDRYRRTEPPAEAIAAARAAVREILVRLGFPEHLLPADGVPLSGWLLRNDPGAFRPWREER